MHYDVVGRTQLQIGLGKGKCLGKRLHVSTTVHRRST